MLINLKLLDYEVMNKQKHITKSLKGVLNYEYSSFETKVRD